MDSERLELTRLLLSPQLGALDYLVPRINEFRPDVIRGYGSVIGALFWQAREQGLPLHAPGAVTDSEAIRCRRQTAN